MARTESTMMLTPGKRAPEFSLPDLDGRLVSRTDFEGKPLLVVFMCNHCPYVKHIADAFSAFAKEYQEKGLAIVGINSNDSSQNEEDSPAAMMAEAAKREYVFPYLFDETQDAAKAYRAACTPDFFLFDREHRLAYRGQFDATRPDKNEDGTYNSTLHPPTGDALRAAADAVLSGQPVTIRQRPSMGCNVKWKSGNEPEYYG